MSSSKVVALAERLRPFAILQGNILVPNPSADLTEENFTEVKAIYTDLLALETRDTFQEEFLLNQVSIGARAILSHFEQHCRGIPA